MKTIPFIYIAGYGHSGSTLLDLMLGSHSRIESVGELKGTRRLFLEESPKSKCTCSRYLSQCPYWSSVRSRVWEHFGMDQGGGTPEGIDPGGKNFQDYVRCLFESVLELSGKPILCESSKNRDRLEAYLALDFLDVTVIHIVRDGRAVAASARKKGRDYWQFLKNWEKGTFKLQKELSLGRKKNAYFRVAYENLANNPEEALAPILDSLGLAFEEPQLHFSRQVHHNLDGNRMRREKDQVIVVDKAYLSLLSAVEWYVGTWMIRKRLKYYGYPYTKSGASKVLAGTPVGNGVV